ncbi:hypothetical protein NDU88_010142 [Pleurodeles waltl]|uniref:Uncharacterized protein n=1 Tax=Pleurodeles waltl TaxID=8319 RepID=A0AAV7PXY9_PLEWA|nr:hypothetical protein NDU88_010142 [Pleurodeles waltl]
MALTGSAWKWRGAPPWSGDGQQGWEAADRMEGSCRAGVGPCRMCRRRRNGKNKGGGRRSHRPKRNNQKDHRWGTGTTPSYSQAIQDHQSAVEIMTEQALTQPLGLEEEEMRATD